MSSQDAVPRIGDSDVTLAVRICDGDTTAFEALFHRYYERLVYAAFSYTRSHDAAEDVVQDVMLAVWEHHTEFAKHTTAAAYLYGAVRNRALNMLAHDAVVQRHAADPGPTSVPATDELVLATELARIAHERIEMLPPRVREVYRLRRDSALSNAEIASILGVSVHTVYMQMARAMKLLRTALAPWMDETPGQDDPGEMPGGS